MTATTTVENPTKTTQDRLNEWTQGSSVNPELTQKWLEQETDLNEIARLLGWKHYYHTPGWYVRTCDPITGKRLSSGQFKPDDPIIFPDSDKPAKYFTFPKGGDSDPLFSVMVLNDWVILSERTGVPIENDDIDETRDDLGFWLWVIKHPSIPIVITEGAKKAGCLLSHGYVAIALCGVWNGQKQKKLHQWLKHFIVPNRPVYLAFDADLVEKESVAAALKQFGRLCLNEKAQIRVISWDLELGKGVDDLIVNHGGEAFSDAMNNAKTYTEWRQKLEDKYRAASSEDIPPHKRNRPPNTPNMADHLAEKYRNQLAYDELAKTWRRFAVESPGTWSPESDIIVEGLVMAELEADPNIGFNYSVKYLLDVKRLLRNKLTVKHWKEADSRFWLPLQDGVLELATMKLHPHAPGFRFTWTLPYRWGDRSLGCQPIQDWLLEIMAGDHLMVELLRAYLRAIATGAVHLQRFLEVVGPGGTGKSTYLKLAQALVGKDNCVVTELKYLEQNRFETATLQNKRLIIVTDADKYGGSVNVLKAITGQDQLRVERKHIQASGNGITAKAMTLIAANEVILSNDYTSGLGRRRITLNFDYQVSEAKQRPLIDLDGDGFTGEFVPYLSGLLAWVLEMPEQRMIELIKNTNQSIPHLNRIRLEKLCDTNPLADWVDECLSLHDTKTYVGIAKRDKASDSPNSYIGVNFWLYASYCEYTTATGHKPISQRRFTGLLHDLLACQLKFKVTRGKDRRGSYFDGIRIRPDDDLSPRIVSGTEPPNTPIDFNSGGSVMARTLDCDGSVMSQTQGRDECDGSDGSVDNSNSELPTENQIIEVPELLAENISQPVNHSSQLPETQSVSNEQPTETLSPNHHTSYPVTHHISSPNAYLIPYLNCIGQQVQSTVTHKRGVVTGLSLGGSYIFLHVEFDDNSGHVPMEPANLVNEQGQPVVSVESIKQGQTVVNRSPKSDSDNKEPDWSNYPHPTSTDVRAAHNRAAKVKEGLLMAGDRLQLEGLKQQFSRNELTWVYRYLLTDSQRQSIKQVANTEQLSLFTE